MTDTAATAENMLGQMISKFLLLVWRSGALQGEADEQAFFVRCDMTTMTQMDIDMGHLICKIGVAPIKPAEFVIFRVRQNTATNTRPDHRRR